MKVIKKYVSVEKIVQNDEKSGKKMTKICEKLRTLWRIMKSCCKIIKWQNIV